ncbi:MAG: hypothetical protein LBF97_08300 [Elusimicrobiota bacterium]|jgi:hypothetical protein|nr:hypothetical protein [Elusimicrobiota bacterium]
MKKIILILILLTFISCISITEPTFYTQNTIKDFDILGEVKYNGGFSSNGDYKGNEASFAKLLEIAKKEYNADYVIDIMIDKKVSWGFFVKKVNFDMQGKAIKYKDMSDKGLKKAIANKN